MADMHAVKIAYSQHASFLYFSNTVCVVDNFHNLFAINYCFGYIIYRVASLAIGFICEN